MKRNMVFKSVTMKGQPEGAVLVKLGLEVETSPDMARDILTEVGDFLDKDVSIDIQAVQKKMDFKAGK